MRRTRQYILITPGLATLLVATSGQAAFADAGVPMMALMAEPMWSLLLIIIPLEAWIAHRILGVPWRKCWLISLVANVVSTILGVPLTWAALAGCEMALDLVVSYSVMPKPILFLTTLPWLYPIESDMYWMAPAAALLLLIPFFFVSVWSEYFVACRMARGTGKPEIWSWSWKANIASYLLMAFIALACLGASLFQHYQTANDEEHRSVDKMSADRLWEMATERLSHDASKKAQAKVPGYRSSKPARRHSVAIKREMDKYYWDARFQRESGDSKSAEKILKAGLAKIDDESYQTSTSFDDKHGDGLNIIEGLADLYFDQDRFAEAIPLYERLVQLEDEKFARIKPDDYETISYPLRLPLCYEKVNEPDKAEKFYEHVISRVSKVHHIFQTDTAQVIIAYADYCKKLNKLAKAQQLYEQAARARQPGVYTGNFAEKKLAEFYMGEGKFDLAEQTLLAAIEESWQMNAREFPNYAAVADEALDLGKSFIGSGSLEQAQHYLKLAMRGRNHLPEVAKTYAQLCGKQNKRDQEKIWLNRAADAAKYDESDTSQ